ncbi:MAG: thiamine phosphate synthase [Alphaproteobacteria bacterium]|nr:thiamine phosphate synthase [Alphaproteobacteria bacterium]
MSDSLERRKLARAAFRLALRRKSILPPLVLMTDDERLADPVAAARRLPRGSMVVVRAREPSRRAALTSTMLELARERHLIVLVADDPALAGLADGLHLPEAKLAQAARWRACRRLLVTGSAHSLGALARARFLDAVFLSPVFPTPSHPERPALSAVRANLMAQKSRVPVYALGGVTARNGGRLYGLCGIAAIGALSPDQT